MKANLFFVLTAIFWGMNYQWSKFLVQETSPFEAALWRYGLASLTILILTFNNLPSFEIIKKHFKAVFIVGFVGLFLFNVIFFQGMQRTSPINAVLIIGMNPALTLILSSIILKTKVKSAHILGIILAFLGVMYLLFEGDYHRFLTLNFGLGDLLIMISNIFFALYHVLVKKYMTDIDNSHFSLLTSIVCLLSLLIINLIFNKFGNFHSYSNQFWLGAIGIGCFGTGLAYWLWNQSIKKTNAAYGALFINLVPLVGFIFPVIWGAHLGSHHLISAVFIISGILVVQFFQREKSQT
jgi:drug/metabolite transporter (DMT)-like permease